MKPILWRPSPHFYGRLGMQVIGTVIHYTAAGRGIGSVIWACDERSCVSWHFLVDRNGDIFQQVKLASAAWHAGSSEMIYRGEMTSRANRFTVGVELANHGSLAKGDHGVFYYEVGRGHELYEGPAPINADLIFDTGHRVTAWWEPYTEEQIKSVKDLVEYIGNEGYEEAAGNLVGHEEIAMPLGRKIDPGPLFPWGEFRRTTSKRTAGSLL